MSELFGVHELTRRRTFLSWLHFAVVLGGLAVGLLNFGDKVSGRVLPILPQSDQAIDPPSRDIAAGRRRKPTR